MTLEPKRLPRVPGRHESEHHARAQPLTQNPASPSPWAFSSSHAGSVLTTILPCAQEEAAAPTCYGLDIGALSLVAAKDDGELLRNELGFNSTASAVSFSGKERLLGEAAANSVTTNGRNTATAVGRLALMPHARVAATSLALHWQFTHAAREGGAFEMEAQYNGEPRRFSGVQLLGALLAKVRSTSAAGESPCVALVVPPCVQEAASAEDKEAALAFARAAMLDAAAIGGWRPVALPTAMEAAAVTLSRKYPPPTSEAAATAEGDEAPKRHVLLVDMGAAATNVAVIGVDEEPGKQLVAEAGRHPSSAAPAPPPLPRRPCPQPALRDLPRTTAP